MIRLKIDSILFLPNNIAVPFTVSNILVIPLISYIVYNNYVIYYVPKDTKHLESDLSIEELQLVR